MRFINGLVFCFMIAAVTNVYSVPTANPLDGVFVNYHMRLSVPVRSVIHSLDGASLEKLLQNYLDSHPIAANGSSAANPQSNVPNVPAVETVQPAAPTPEQAEPATQTPEGQGEPATQTTEVQAEPATQTPEQAQAEPATQTPEQAQAEPATQTPEQAQAEPATQTPEQAQAEPATQTPEQAQAEPASTTPEGTQERKRREIDVENGDESKIVLDPEFEETLRKSSEEVAKVLAESGNGNIKAFYLRGTITVSPLV